MFTVSKILWFVLAPLNLAIILIVAAMLCLLVARQKGGADTFALRHTARRLSTWLGVAGCAVLFIFAVLPTGYILASALENRYDRPEKLPAHIAGIIVLGGAIDTDIGLSRHETPQFNAAADRLLAFANLAHRYPYAKLLYTGGVGNGSKEATPEATMAERALKQLGFNPRNRLIIEDASRTTAENAALSFEKIQPKDTENWLLVTSATHMPRAMGAFRNAGWNVTAYPTDYLTGGRDRDVLAPDLTFLQNLTLSHIAIKELLGIAGYSLSGKWSPAAKPDTEMDAPDA